MPPRSLTALVGAVALSGCTVFGIRTVEQPTYEVVDRLGGGTPVEVRRYPPRLEAETVVDARGGTWQAESDAFRTLAGFIFGNNRQRQEVAMTITDYRAAALEGRVVPIIDIAPWSTGGPAGRDRVAGEVDAACCEIGFFLVTGHGVADAYGYYRRAKAPIVLAADEESAPSALRTLLARPPSGAFLLPYWESSPDRLAHDEDADLRRWSR